MKLYLRLILAVLAATATLTACTKEITPPNFENDKVKPDSTQVEEGSRIITVSFAPQTRTYLDEGLQPKFENNDKILVSNGTEKKECSIIVDKNGNASFVTTLTGPLKAVYPAKAAKLKGNDIEGVLVSTVQSGKFADANICMAENINTAATFVNKTAVFKIITDAEAEYVEVSTNKADIANSISGEYADLKKINVEAGAGDTVFVSILPADHIVEDLSLSDSTTTKTFAGNKTQVAINTFYTTAITADNFYIIGGADSDWDVLSKAKKFTHSEKPIVEDPWFTITIPAASLNDTWFAITDDAVCDAEDWPHVFGTTKGNGNNGDSGFAARRKYLDNDAAFCVPYGCDSIKVDFNALTFEYRVTEIGTVTPSVTFPDRIYEIGNEGGWDHKNSHPLVKLAGLAGFPGVEDGIYQGYYYLNGEYKFKPNADDWVGDWEFGGSYDDNEGMNMMVNGGPDSNFPLTEGEGFYQINVDLNTMKARLVKVESIGLVGDFNGWGNDVEMTYDVAGGYWECDATLNKNGVKVRMNHDWKTNWGGQTNTSFDNLQQNGENFIVSAGTYHVKFYLSCEGQNHIVFELIE